MAPMNRRDKAKQEARRTSARDWTKQPEGKAFEQTCLVLPDGVDWYKLEPGTHKVDFMPYRVTWGRDSEKPGGNPRADEGFEHYERQYTAHRVPGFDGKAKMYVSRATWGKKDAVQTWLAQHAQTAPKELVESLKEKARCIWIVNDQPGSKKPAFKILETYRFNRGFGFEELMVDAINALPEDADPFSLEHGMTAILTVKEQSSPFGKFNAVTRIDFQPRKYSYPPSVLDAAPDLDRMLIDPGFDKVMKLLEGAGDAEEEGEDQEPPRNGKPTGKGKAAAADDDEDAEDSSDSEDDEEEVEEPSETEEPEDEEEDSEDAGDAPAFAVGDVVLYDDEECSIIKVSGDGTSLTLKNAKGQKFPGVAPEDVEKVDAGDEDAEDEDEAPPPKKGKKLPEPEEDEEEDAEEDSGDDEPEEDDLDDEDDLPPPPKKKGGKR